GHHGDRREIHQVKPCEVAIGAVEMVEMRLLADPEYAERHEAEQICEKARPEAPDGRYQAGLGCDSFVSRDVDLHHDHRQRDREQTVAERSDSLDTGPCNSV